MGLIEDPNRILRDGLEFDNFSRHQAAAVESLGAAGSVLAVYGDPFPKKAWGALSGHFRKLARKAQEFEVAERWRTCRQLCKKMPDGSSPWDAMVIMWEVHANTGNRFCDDMARGMFRDEAYKFINKEFGGRDVG